jgi:hypothetical protein
MFIAVEGKEWIAVEFLQQYLAFSVKGQTFCHRSLAHAKALRTRSKPSLVVRELNETYHDDFAQPIFVGLRSFQGYLCPIATLPTVCR